MGYLANSD